MAIANNTMTNKTATSSSLIVDTPASETLKNQNAVTTVDSAKLKLEDMTELDALQDASIVAKPLMMPENLNIRVKRKEFSYRWVAYKNAGGKNLEKFQFMGYRKATLDDVEPYSESASANPDGIINGDLLLMKIPKDLYLAHIKENYKRANVAFTKNAEVNTLRDSFPNGIPRASNGEPLISFFKDTNNSNNRRGEIEL